ncbi:uncharacterized protein LOC129808478 [Phlebotomus papatasi]|uniref:uncharacterized protein LOC129808478 n=1 Tax=Phlebotomus papatasi TaxID=29031 RepID=UPI002483CF9B|nr:uncharacterized protein LOC129808478 [Phlebotomus papatasi]
MEDAGQILSGLKAWMEEKMERYYEMLHGMNNRQNRALTEIRERQARAEELQRQREERAERELAELKQQFSLWTLNMTGRSSGNALPSVAPQRAEKFSFQFPPEFSSTGAVGGRVNPVETPSIAQILEEDRNVLETSRLGFLASETVNLGNNDSPGQPQSPGASPLSGNIQVTQIQTGRIPNPLTRNSLRGSNVGEGLGDLGINSQCRDPDRLKLKVDTYDGKAVLEDYLLQFEMVARARNWNAVEQAIMLASSLRGEALAVLFEIPLAKRNNLVDLVRALRTRFGREFQQGMSHLNLRSRRQLPRKEIGAFALEIQKLTHLAFRDCPESARDKIALGQFVDGFADLDLQDLVRLTRPCTLEQAVYAAIDYDAAREANRASRSVFRAALVGVVAEPSSGEVDRRSDPLSGQSGGAPTSSGNKKKFVNYKKKGGNFGFGGSERGSTGSSERSDTRSSERNGSSTGWRARSCTPPAWVPAVDDAGATGTQGRSGAPSASIGDTRSIGPLCRGTRVGPGYGAAVNYSARGLVVNGCVGNVACEIVVDTGANYTLISRRIYEALNPKPSLRPVKWVLTTATGQNSPILGELEVLLTLDACTLQVTVFVADIVEDCVLGLTFLQQRVARLDLKSMKLVFEEGNLTELTLVKVPEYLRELYGQAVRGLTESQAGKVRGLLLKHSNVFSKTPWDIGRTELAEHAIGTGDHAPIKQPPRRFPIAKASEMERLVEDMLQQGVIEPSTSPWASPVVLVKKKDGTTRFCVDYSRLNSVTKKDSFPLPRIDDTLDALRGSSWFSVLDLCSGYWQCSTRHADKEKTAFTTGRGLYQWVVMSFGLCNAVATFERLMSAALAGLQWDTCLVYLDDIIVPSRTFEEGIHRLDLVLEKLWAANLKASHRKCKFFQRSVEYLGHVVSGEGIQAAPSKLEAVENWPVPRNKTHFADIARPLHRLTEKSVRFQWSSECQACFEMLKRCLTSSPILSYPHDEGEYVLDCDTSAVGVGAVLQQVQDGTEKVIAYYSQALSGPERNYCATRRELLAVVKAVSHFHHFLYGRHFLIRSDHATLRWLLTMKSPEGQLARWLEKLGQYDFELRHRAGRVHENADAFSRRPCAVSDGGHCDRVEERMLVEELSSEDSCAHNNAPLRPVAVSSELATDIAAATEDDDVLREVKLLLSQGERPEWEAISGGPALLKRFWGLFASLKLERGVICYQWETGRPGNSKNFWVLPERMLPTLLRELHTAPSGGHFGISRTLDRLKERFYAVGSRTAVEKLCRECDVCAARKGPGRRIVAPLQPRVSGEPFERVASDILGPFPVTARGNRQGTTTGGSSQPASRTRRAGREIQRRRLRALFLLGQAESGPNSEFGCARFRSLVHVGLRSLTSGQPSRPSGGTSVCATPAGDCLHILLTEEDRQWADQEIQ